MIDGRARTPGSQKTILYCPYDIYLKFENRNIK